MKKRRHHNNKGFRRTKLDKRKDQVEQIVRKIFGRRVVKLADGLHIRERKK